MEKNTLVVGVVALIIGVGIGYIFWGSFSSGPGSRMMSDGTRMSQNIDQYFIVQMIPHHEGAIAMAKVALERSKRPEILSLANGIIQAQEAENAQMRTWYEAWYGEAPATLNYGHSGMMNMGSVEGDLALLKAASDFDIEFINQMIPHHEMAIMMAQMLQSSTERDEMKTLADNIITSQAREIDMMRSWRAAWMQ